MSTKLKSIFMDLSTPEEQEDLLLVELEKLHKRLEQLDEEIEKRSSRHEKHLKDVLDTKIDKYLTDVKSKTDVRLRNLNVLIKSVEDKIDVVSSTLPNQIENIRDDIKKEITEDITGLLTRQDAIKDDLSTLIKTYFLDYLKKEKEVKKDILNLKEAIDKDIQILKSRQGGGSKPITVALNGTVVNTRFADFNLIATGSATSNSTTQRTDITLTGGAGGLSKLTATGTIDDSNTAFTYASKPTLVCVNGQMYPENSGWTWNSGNLTATYSGPVGLNGFTFGLG